MAMTDAQKRAQERYRRARTTQVLLKLHRDNDSDIIDRLEEEPSKNGYIKRLIREDIATRANKTSDAREQDE